MTRRRVFLAFVPVVALAVGAVAQEPLTIHLKAGTARETTAQEDKALEAKFRAAQKAFDEVEKALKKQHGKDVEAWPEAAQEELRVARDTMAQAGTDWFYSGIKQKDIDDTPGSPRSGCRTPGRARRARPPTPSSASLRSTARGSPRRAPRTK